MRRIKDRIYGASLNGLIFASCLAFAASVFTSDYRKPLTFEDRVGAQEAIERVYFEHRIWPKENPGPKPPFERMISRAQIEGKVEDYLKKSAALEKFWQRPLTAEHLQAEMDRMAKQTKDPNTLRELFTALDSDPYLIAECLARPILADRLIRNWNANDGRFHGETRKQAEEAIEAWSAGNFCTPEGAQYHKATYRLESESQGGETLPGETEPGSMALPQKEFGKRWKESPAEGELSGIEQTPEEFIIQHTLRKTASEIEMEILSFQKQSLESWLRGLDGLPVIPEKCGESSYSLPPIPGLSCFEEWDNGILDDMPDAREGHTAVWTGTEMIIWGGNNSNSGGRYSPATDSWAPTSIGANVPLARSIHTAVWTGTQMIVWGGYAPNDPDMYTNTGGRYEPVTDSWIPTSTGTGAPSGRVWHSAVWTGSAMIIWGGAYYEGGYHYLNSGGRYDPMADAWLPTSVGSDVPSARSDHSGVWTGTVMVVWGGSCIDCNTGGRYDPATDAWLPTSMTGEVPSKRYGHAAVWTGTEMIIWGGISGSYPNTGGRYNPVTDVWMATSTGANVPTGRIWPASVWTGTEMIVWGGYCGTNCYTLTGGQYDPSTDSWLPTSTGANVPTARSYHTAVWTGSEMIIWGGQNPTIGNLNTGGRYDPSVDSWVPTSTGGDVPSSRWLHTAVWTGSEMIVWGGQNYSGHLGTGGRYDPSIDSWFPTSTGTNAPAPRRYHKAVWTGTEMIVWGGSDISGSSNTGGRYNPSSDSWLPTSTGTNVPSARSGHTAIWTGTEMIIWGGSDISGSSNTGGRYNPSSDSWLLTPTGANVPAARESHTALWTGIVMIIWGGLPYTNTGGCYSPSMDSWIPTFTGANVPSGRAGHTAVWTGTEMIVWGGYYYDTSGHYLNTGGRYDPDSNTWRSTSIGADVPQGRGGHTAVWTDMAMIIWGGSYGNMMFLNTGGRYNPAEDSWASTLMGAHVPSARGGSAAVWTGFEMIVWGGYHQPIYVNSGGRYVPYAMASPPSILGDSENACPAASVTLSTEAIYESYQWYLNGQVIDGATTSSCEATASGGYSVTVTTAEGCTGSSVIKSVTIIECSMPEVSPKVSPFPLRILADGTSSTGFFLYFEKIPSAEGYNIYEGSIGGWYSHGDAPGSDCATVVSDLGTGEMRAELAPDSGNRYYLVTAFGGADEGPSGFDSADVEIPSAQSTCPP
jgi:hypothetical protein